MAEDTATTSSGESAYTEEEVTEEEGQTNEGGVVYTIYYWGERTFLEFRESRNLHASFLFLRREEGGVASGGGERRCVKGGGHDERDERPRQGLLGRVVFVVGPEELCEDEVGVRVERLPQQQRHAAPVRRDQK